MANDNKIVRFTHQHEQYTTGQLASLPAADADRLIAEGVAEARDQAQPAGGGAAPGPTGERDMNTPGWSNSPPAEPDKTGGGPAPGVEKRER